MEVSSIVQCVLKAVRVWTTLGVWKGKGAVEVLDAKADEDKEMGNDDEKPMRVCYMIPKEGDILL
jgi:hypothetical protein